MGIELLRDSLFEGADYIDPTATATANHDMKLHRLPFHARVEKTQTRPNTCSPNTGDFQAWHLLCNYGKTGHSRS